MFFAISKKDVDCEVMWRKISFYALIKHGFLTYESERAQVPFCKIAHSTISRTGETYENIFPHKCTALDLQCYILG